jgi:hypothetical protein
MPGDLGDELARLDDARGVTLECVVKGAIALARSDAKHSSSKTSGTLGTLVDQWNRDRHKK